ncbi:MAG: TIGR02266 family protein [Deltaproteobacteria bacterium]|nr:TIGR02266 family protein [Deltaproteobacteria bacterium]
MDNTSKEKRAPTALKVKYRSESIDEFIEQAGLNISRGGIFVRTKKPMAPNTPLKFEFQLSDSTPVIRGVGRVAWVREKDEDKERPAGMGVKFLKLDDSGRALVERIVNERGEIRSRFDFQEGKKPAMSQPSSAKPPLVPAPARQKIPIKISRSPAREEAKKPASHVEHVGEFLASALSESGVEHKVTKESQAKESQAKESHAGERARTENKFNRSQSLADELFGDIDIPAERSAPIIDPASLSKPPRPVEKKDAGIERFDAFLETDSDESELSDKAKDENEDREEQDLVPLFSDRSPRLSGRAEAPRPEQEVSAPDRVVDDNKLEETASPGTPSDDSSAGLPEPSRISLGPYDSASHPSDPPGLSPPPLDATLPLSLSPPRLQPGSSNRVLVIGLSVCVFLGLVGGGGAYLFINKDRIFHTSIQSETGSPQKTAETERSKVDFVVPVKPSEEQKKSAVRASYEQPEPKATATEPEEKEAADEMIEVQITSVPRDAEILVEDEPKGRTPARIELPVGKPVTISVKASGFVQTTRVVTAQKREPPIRFKLAPKEYILSVKTFPPGAKVTVRGQSVISPEPLNLGHINGMISVTLTKEGHRPVVLPVRLDQFEEVDNVMSKQLLVKLNPLPARSEVVKLKPEPQAAPASTATEKATPESAPAEPESAKPIEEKPIESAPKTAPAPKLEAVPEATEPKPPPAQEIEEVKPNPY